MSVVLFKQKNTHNQLHTGTQNTSQYWIKYTTKVLSQ